MRKSVFPTEPAGAFVPLFLIILLVSPLPGMENPAWTFSQLMPENARGQSFPLVHCLIQDRQGFIWIAGPYGLMRYEG